VSEHRREVNAERLKLQEAAWGPRRWWRCWFEDRPLHIAEAGTCRGEVWGHEILFRSRAGSTDENLLDIANQVPLCNYHNSWVSNHSRAAERMGLAKHSWEK
jgi:hypothetical protein